MLVILPSQSVDIEFFSKALDSSSFKHLNVIMEGNSIFDILLGPLDNLGLYEFEVEGPTKQF